MQDTEFIAAVKVSSFKSWSAFLKLHPGCEGKMNEAKRIIELFEIREEPLDNARKTQLWLQIEADRQVLASARIRYLYRMIAAAVVVAALLVAGMTWNKNKNSRWYFEHGDLVSTIDMDQSTLILSNGNKVDLESKKAAVAVIDSLKAIRIDGEKIIELEEEEPKRAKSNPEVNEIIVPYGDETSLELADGTKVWLNAGSRIAFPTRFSGDVRKVYLEGEAYFEVTENKKMPFVVTTHDVAVKVYGTKFNLSAYRNDRFTETVLLEGSVSITRNKSIFGKETYLEPGQKAMFNNQKNNISVEEIKSPVLYTSWREGWYQFSDVNLTYVTHKLERYYNVWFVLDDDVIRKSSRISGKLELKKSIEEVLSVLTKVSKTNYQMEGDKIVLSINEKNKD